MKRIAIEEIADHPLPGMSFPTRPKVAPGGQHLTFLASESGDLTRQLYALDLSTGQRSQTFRTAITDEADLPLDE